MSDNPSSSDASNFLAKFRDPASRRFKTVTSTDFLECWRHYDRDNSGYLEGEELDGFLREFIASVVPGNVGGEVVSEAALEDVKQEFMRAYDINEDGRIDITEMAQVLPVDETFLALFRCDAPLSSSVDFIRLWKQYDVDNSGSIDKAELTNFLNNLLTEANINVTAEKLESLTQTILELFDRDNDGKLQLSEMARLLPVKENYLVKPLFKNANNLTSRDIDRVFRKYDKDDNGTLEGDELEGFLKDLLEASGDDWDEVKMRQVQEAIMEQFDENKDGKIGRDELNAIFLQSIRMAQEAKLLHRTDTNKT